MPVVLPVYQQTTKYVPDTKTADYGHFMVSESALGAVDRCGFFFESRTYPFA
jgi:hypothetical protein